MFYHSELLLKVLFSPIGRGPGIWIRLMTFYRMYDAVGVLVKCTIPILLLVEPRLLLAFILFSYFVLAVKLAFYRYLYGPGCLKTATGLAYGFLMFPAYEYLIWISRLAAFPRAMWLRGRSLAKLGEFGDYCMERLDTCDKPLADVRINL